MKNILFCGLLIILLIIPINYMSEVWGMMSKSQIDNEKVEEAIARMIAEHEANPTAHTGEGESLATHRANEIIDHPQQSVVMDKLLFSFYDEMSEPIGGHGWDPDVGTIQGAGTRNIYFSLFSQSAVYTQMALPFDAETPYPYADLILRFHLYLNGAQNSNGFSTLSFFSWEGADIKGRIDFSKEGTEYKIKYYNNNILLRTYILQAGGQFSGFIAIYYNKQVNKIDIFLDGRLIDSYTPTIWYDFIPYLVSASGSRTTNTNIELELKLWGAKYTLF